MRPLRFSPVALAVILAAWMIAVGALIGLILISAPPATGPREYPRESPRSSGAPSPAPGSCGGTDPRPCE